jgi:hypothetical protein
MGGWAFLDRKLKLQAMGYDNTKCMKLQQTGVSPCRSRTGITQCLKLATPAEHPEPPALA